MRLRFLSYLIFCLLMLIASPSLAANIKGYNYSCYYFGTDCDGKQSLIVIEGEIVAGDYEKFIQVILSQPITYDVVLRSRGENIDEAFKIGRVIRELYIATEAPERRYADFDLLDIPYCDEKNNS